MARDIVAIYGRDEAGGWREAARLAIDRAPGEAAATALRPVALDDGALWVVVSGPAGAAAAHRLLAFDGSTLRLLLEGARPFEFVDLDGDGAPEVVVDSGDRDVLCGGCGVVAAVGGGLPAGRGGTDAAQPRPPWPPSAPAELRAAVERAVELAEADLWRDAAAAIDRALSLADGNEAVTASGALIDATATRRLAHAQESPFSLLALVLAGEYEAAVELLRELAPAAIFDRAGPVVAGTVADGHVDALASALVDYARACGGGAAGPCRRVLPARPGALPRRRHRHARCGDGARRCAAGPGAVALRRLLRRLLRSSCTPSRRQRAGQ